MNFRQDSTIMQRPNCAACDGAGAGWILLAGQLVCGDCAIKWDKKKNAMIFEAIKDGN